MRWQPQRKEEGDEDDSGGASEPNVPSKLTLSFQLDTNPSSLVKVFRLFSPGQPHTKLKDIPRDIPRSSGHFQDISRIFFQDFGFYPIPRSSQNPAPLTSVRNAPPPSPFERRCIRDICPGPRLRGREGETVLCCHGNGRGLISN